MKTKKSGSKRSASKKKAKEVAPKVMQKCIICEYTTLEKYRMKRHMRTHTGEKPFMCGVCDQSFSQKSSLKEHLWKHTALRSSDKCPHCNAIFNLPVDVKAHINHMHSECEPITCTLCQGVYNDRYSLLQHQKTHENMYRYQCLECIFASKDKMKLIYHMSIHKKRKPLMCSACKETFMHKHNLLNHLFRKHDISTFGDGYTMPPLASKRETPINEEPSPTKKTINQLQLEEQFQIVDEEGNTLQLSEADAEAIHAAMQQSSEDGSLEIMQGEEGTMTVTVLTVAHNLDGSIQNIEQNVELPGAGEDVAEESFEQREDSENANVVVATAVSGTDHVYEMVQVADTQGDESTYVADECVVVPSAVEHQVMPEGTIS